LQLELLVFQRSHECLDKGEALFRLLGISNEEFVVTVRLEFRRLVSEGPANAFAEQKFGASSGGIAVWKAFPSEIFHLSKELLELLRCTSDIF
jgi:hypothetical protein